MDAHISGNDTLPTLSERRPTLIAIDGRSGVGKTTLALDLLTHLTPTTSVALIHLDELYPGWDGLAAGVHAYTRDILTPLRSGRPAHWRAWDWEHDCPGPRHLNTPAAVIILEGVGAAQAPELVDLTIWLEADSHWRKQRALERDGETFAPHWERWEAQEEALLAAYHPQSTAHVVATHTDINDHKTAPFPPTKPLIDAITALCSLPTPPAEPPPPAGRYTLSTTWKGEPAELFTALYGQSQSAVWLDSVDTTRGRYSVMADATGPHSRSVHHHEGITEERHRGYHLRTREPMFSWLRRHCPSPSVSNPAANLPADAPQPGWYGYLSYELKRETGGDHLSSPGPEAEFILPDRMLILDHHTSQMHVWESQSDPAEANTTWFTDTHRIVKQLDASPSADGTDKALLSHESASTDTVAAAVELKDTREAYLQTIKLAQQEIAAGNSYEVCLSTHLRIKPLEDPLTIYRHIRSRNRAPMGAYLRFGQRAILSASLERLLHVLPDRTVQTCPIKGTRPRLRVPELDRALAKELTHASKDRAENLMIVDLMRNDLSRCCTPGSIRVPHLFEVQSYPSIHQLVSTIEGTLSEKCVAIDALTAAFPAGSMTGAPKVSTMSILTRLEAAGRGVYSGAIGYISATGTADFSVVIRTLVIDGSQGTLGVGGAITADSDPETEWQEVQTKAQGIVEALGLNFPDA